MSGANQERLLELEAERRLERWLVSDELKEFMLQAEEVSGPPTRTGPYITISREAGAGGTHVARLVAEQLGWDVLDKELLDFMTARYKLPRDLLEYVDETRADFVHDALRTAFSRRTVSQSSYLLHLERTLYLAAMHGRVVIVGRAAHCILPRGSGMAVRIVAPREKRIAWTIARRAMNEAQAAKLVDQVDAGRDELCKYYFHSDNCDAHLFDLVINAERLSATAIAEQIVFGYREIEQRSAKARCN